MNIHQKILIIRFKCCKISSNVLRNVVAKTHFSFAKVLWMRPAVSTAKPIRWCTWATAAATQTLLARLVEDPLKSEVAQTQFPDRQSASVWQAEPAGLRAKASLSRRAAASKNVERRLILTIVFCCFVNAKAYFQTVYAFTLLTSTSALSAAWTL